MPVSSSSKYAVYGMTCLCLSSSSKYAVYGMTCLCLSSASKYAVYGMTEALGEEIKKLGKPGVKTTVVCPTFVDTGLCKFPLNR